MKDPGLLERLVEAVLYEGYILYPYRASSKKNAQRFTFGRVYPDDYSRAQRGAEPSTMQTECLVRAASRKAALEVRLRFLHPLSREIRVRRPETGDFVPVPQCRRGERLYQAWQECVEQDVAVARLALHESGPLTEHTVFHFPGSKGTESVEEDVQILRRQEILDGEVTVTATPVDDTVWRIQVSIANLTAVPENLLAKPEEIIMRTFASTHTILRAHDAGFLSLLEPPAEYEGAAGDCRNVGMWPILVGDASTGECDTMLSSPIILYDYPQIAPESPGNLFDGTEIDEILTLRIMAMTDEEKLEARHLDEHARRMLERTESLPEDYQMRLHGTMREVAAVDGDAFPPGGDEWAAGTRLQGVEVHGTWVEAGDHVRIRPRRRADAMDLFLAGKTAVVEAVEQDAEGAVHLALVLEDDPGRDLGMLRQPGHRFFYTSDEVEPVKGGA